MRSYWCCRWCCSPVLLLWFGHTHAHKCASDLWVEGIRTLRDTRGCAGPGTYLSDVERAQTPRSTTSHVLQRGFTATPARCCAALYGVDCLSVRAAKAVSLSRARQRSACLSHLSTNGEIIAAATATITDACPNKKSLQNLVFR